MDLAKLESINQKFHKLLDKVQELEDKCSVYFSRKDHRDQIAGLRAVTGNAAQQMMKFKLSYARRMENIQKDYRRYQKLLFLQQHQMLFLLSALDDQANQKPKASQLPRPQVVVSNVLKPIQQNTPLPNVHSARFSSQKMSVAQYESSPFVGRKKPMQLHFLDFEVDIREEEFLSIPKYMRGREKLDDLMDFVRKTLVPTFSAKYMLIHKKREAIQNPQDIEIWRMYKEQESYFPRQHFITEGDIARQIGKLVDKKMNMKITMLRHLGILKEERKNKAVCYIWTLSNPQ